MLDKQKGILYYGLVVILLLEGVISVTLKKIAKMWVLQEKEGDKWQFVGFEGQVSARLVKDKVVIDSPKYRQCPTRTIPADTVTEKFSCLEGTKLSDIMQEGIIYDYSLFPLNEGIPALVK